MKTTEMSANCAQPLQGNARNPVGAGLLAMIVNDDAGEPAKRGLPIASKPAPTDSRQHRHQPTLAIQFGQVVEAADMHVADENLRHAASTAAAEHFFEFARLGLNIDFLHRDAFARQQ